MAAKISTRHPYAAIEHRVIDSPAYADLSFSAKALLTLLSRQLSRDNNGHLQASFTWCKKFGFGSEHTLRNAIAELISHGFIYRTRSHGANGAWARYAVTWLSIKQRDGLFLDGFKPCAWRDWQPSDKKSSQQKMPDQSGRKCSFTLENPAESAGSTPAENADYELVPIGVSVSDVEQQKNETEIALREGKNPANPARPKKSAPQTRKTSAGSCLSHTESQPAIPIAIYHAALAASGADSLRQQFPERNES